MDRMGLDAIDIKSKSILQCTRTTLEGDGDLAQGDWPVECPSCRGDSGFVGEDMI